MADLADLPPWVHVYIAPNVLDGTTKWEVKDYTVTIWIALALVVLRVVAEAVFLPVTRSFLKLANEKLSKDAKGLKKTAFSVFDNAWIATFSGLLAVFAWYTTVFHNGNCTPWSTKDCFVGWPNHDTHQFQRWFMLSMFAYYLHEMVGTVVGVGTRLKVDMIVHHTVTLALIVIAYVTGLHCMSVMWQALFDVSNPVLHSAKALHLTGVKALEPLKWSLFNLFALVFFVFRIVGGAISILYPCWRYPFGLLPDSWCYICWSLIIAIYSLQLIWFYKIVKLATNPASAEKED